LLLLVCSYVCWCFLMWLFPACYSFMWLLACCSFTWLLLAYCSRSMLLTYCSLVRLPTCFATPHPSHGCSSITIPPCGSPLVTPSHGCSFVLLLHVLGPWSPLWLFPPHCCSMSLLLAYWSPFFKVLLATLYCCWSPLRWYSLPPPPFFVGSFWNYN
jgi:hypothetical protein